MATALIFAGGSGQRMNARTRPKQFLELHGKPIIMYTLEHFEAHPEIDAILVVCIESWIAQLRYFLRVHEYRKVIGVVPGGDGGDKSIYNGLKALGGRCSPDDVVLIHDGVRPFITAELISASIAKARERGTAITVEAATESIARLDRDGGHVAEVTPRGKMHVVKAPQAFRYGMISDLYERARMDGVRVIDSAHLCSVYGVEMHVVKSTPNNMKITEPADYYIFRALLEAAENRQIFGF